MGKVDEKQADRDGRVGENRRVELPAIDLRPLLKNVGGDRAFAAELISGFLERCPALLLEIREALRQGEGGRAALAAHNLSGSAAEFEAHLVLRTAREMERLARLGSLDGAQSLLPTLDEAVLRMQTELAAFCDEGTLHYEQH